VQRGTGLVIEREQALGVGQESGRARRQLGHPLSTREEDHAFGFLQASDSHRDGGLRQVQASRCARKAPQLRHEDEGTERIQVENAISVHAVSLAERPV
jgi:hypothetical protein